MENTLTIKPSSRPEAISELLRGLDRFDAAKLPVFQEYVKQQCNDGSFDIEANLALLKLYQMNPQAIPDEDTILAILSKGLVRFYAPDFTLALHLLPCHVLGDVSSISPGKDEKKAAAPATANNTAAAVLAANNSSSQSQPEQQSTPQSSSTQPESADSSSSAAATATDPTIGTDNLSESIQRLCTLYALLDSAKFAEFWSMYEDDDAYADAVCNVTDFEDSLRLSIAKAVELSSRKFPATVLQEWTNISGNKFNDWVVKTLGWSFENDASKDIVVIPSNKDNEIKTVVTNEAVHFEQLGRLIKRGFEIK